ncbi:hypothetical protein [Nodosilinea sp. E11]|uniref:hypothetical protein n=1 Tax=Nodosilinea sp. E11 TaxID=3037479 RepID=UPI0029348564|nr:hypothetical protein [Nodosilinea sp. E11]WOD37352.1 hypothetical protein RRF56_02430 [Nodosilinea sp. E11]
MAVHDLQELRQECSHRGIAYKAGGQTLIDGINIKVASSGYYGWGEQANIAAHVSTNQTGHEVVDTWPIAQPSAA